MLWDFIKLHKSSIEFNLEILFLMMYNMSEQMFGKRRLLLHLFADCCKISDGRRLPPLQVASSKFVSYVMLEFPGEILID